MRCASKDIEGGAVPQGMQLVESQTFSTGVLNLIYRPATPGNGS